MIETITPVEWTPRTTSGQPAPQTTVEQVVTTRAGTTRTPVPGWQVAAGLAVCRSPLNHGEQYRYDLLHTTSGRVLVGRLCHRHTPVAAQQVASFGVDWTLPAEQLRDILRAHRTVTGLIPGWPSVDCQTCCSLRATLPAGSGPWVAQADRLRALVDAGETPWVRWRGGGRTPWMVQAVGEGVVDLVDADVGCTVLATDVRLGQA